MSCIIHDGIATFFKCTADCLERWDTRKYSNLMLFGEHRTSSWPKSTVPHQTTRCPTWSHPEAPPAELYTHYPMVRSFYIMCQLSPDPYACPDLLLYSVSLCVRIWSLFIVQYVGMYAHETANSIGDRGAGEAYPQRQMIPFDFWVMYLDRTSSEPSGHNPYKILRSQVSRPWSFNCF